MKKLTLFLLLLPLFSEAQNIFGIANNTDWSWSISIANSPTSTYGNRRDLLWTNKDTTALRANWIKVDSLRDNDDSAPNSVAWVDNTGMLKRSLLSTFMTSAGILNQTQADVRYVRWTDTIPNEIMTKSAANAAIAAVENDISLKADKATTLTVNGITKNLSTNQVWTLTTSDISEGSKLFYTDARARNAISLTIAGSGAATYNSSTGVLNIPVSSGGTVTSVGITGSEFVIGSPVTSSGNISLALATSGVSAGTYGNSATVPVVTFDSKGRATSVTTAAIAFPGASSIEATATGTAYNLTSTYQKVTLGTTSPTVTLPSAGTYLIMTNAKVDYVGLTTLSAGNVNLKLRRTNNTAADILATSAFPLDIVALLTSTANDVDVRQFLYTTATSGDIIELWGQVTNTISVGSVRIAAAGATLTAVKLY